MSRSPRVLLRPREEPLLPPVAGTQQLQPADHRAAAGEGAGEAAFQAALRGRQAPQGTASSQENMLLLLLLYSDYYRVIVITSIILLLLYTLSDAIYHYRAITVDPHF